MKKLIVALALLGCGACVNYDGYEANEIAACGDVCLRAGGRMQAKSPGAGCVCEYPTGYGAK